MKTVDTIRYYPEHISNIEEFKRIAKSYDTELRLIWQALGKQYTNQYFDDMDAETCSRWEALIGIQLTGFESLETRRLTIKGRWTSSLPYTKPKFEEVLDAMVGPGYYTMDISVEDKTLDIGIMLAETGKVDSVYDLMRAMAPADMVVNVEIAYNRWLRFKTETWADTWDSGADTWNDVKANAKWQED